MENTVNYAALIMRYSGSGQWDRSLDAAKEWLSKDPESAAAFRAARAFEDLGSDRLWPSLRPPQLCCGRQLHEMPAHRSHIAPNGEAGRNHSRVDATVAEYR